jgi:hypothetical protein
MPGDVPSKHREIEVTLDASPNVLFCSLRQVGSAPVEAARQFWLGVSRIHAKAQPGDSIAQSLHQSQQRVGLLHWLTARKCNSIERTLLIRGYNPIRDFNAGPFLTSKGVALRIPAIAAAERTALKVNHGPQAWPIHPAAADKTMNYHVHLQLLSEPYES